jgi:hypothetical protein
MVLSPLFKYVDCGCQFPVVWYVRYRLFEVKYVSHLYIRPISSLAWQHGQKVPILGSHIATGPTLLLVPKWLRGNTLGYLLGPRLIWDIIHPINQYAHIWNSLLPAKISVFTNQIRVQVNLIDASDDLIGGYRYFGG